MFGIRFDCRWLEPDAEKEFWLNDIACKECDSNMKYCIEAGGHICDKCGCFCGYDYEYEE